ncbi:Non-structural maintenance of chromosomes element 1 [Fulvia fulva]|uniref:Non-structural maintenance of chromosomes element 1 homolog n=1 Tax=Passalora fulva TaxID=5499 RepID=A0A9Q8US17_PASFU|nr:Non-structural maintenance of chromosomes element 1 [Fulvia fulva]KAK4620201.1 Non-structural maintenance of chromosomes element 1 [Fulvia fulva]KAK4620445.1 Non-structural maintenance of chromosomes element 1 [Fulvia fulva]UJO20394.1 Non-structural maintenance of chromosomes element 1 [Fulvia fulva]WPV17159.1 Non-structural maintenance of chromosomes element 1 [Fulvia fulva]WPV32440.1 Non-structural maintenance of chromosomes element 1 [Fulvia fulva]
MSDPDHDIPTSHYNDTHRAYLQSLNACQTTTFEKSKPILAAIFSAHDRPTAPEDITQEDFESYISTLTDALSPFDLEIRSSLHQRSKERIYALVNVESDAMTQMATVHTPDEIAFVKRVLDAMFERYNTERAEVMAVTSLQALKCAKVGAAESGNATQGAKAADLTMSQAERMLEAMVEEGWFDLSQKGFYSLSQRGIMELRSWLVEMYNDEGDEEQDDDEVQHIRIKDCAACRDIVTVGQRCPNLPCNTRVHNGCLRNFLRIHRDEKCPGCGTLWKDAPPVGEKAARNVPGGGGRRSTNGTAAGRSSVVTNGHEDGEEDDESDDE